MPVSRALRRAPGAEGDIERIRFQTETGSVYEISRDEDGMRWRRLSATLGSGRLRDEGARLVAWPTVRLGERCELLSEPLVPPFGRQVQTSWVVAILEAEPALPELGAAPIPDSFRYVQVGDVVTRLLGGSIPMRLQVTDLDDELIHCGGWTFDRDSGFEVDEDLGWGLRYGITGSFLEWEPKSAREVDR